MDLPRPSIATLPRQPVTELQEKQDEDKRIEEAMRKLDVLIQSATNNIKKQMGMATMLVVIAAARYLRANPGGGNRQRLRKGLISDLEKRLHKYLKAG